jgi:hypothetical protein
MAAFTPWPATPSIHHAELGQQLEHTTQVLVEITRGDLTRLETHRDQLQRQGEAIRQDLRASRERLQRLHLRARAA